MDWAKIGEYALAALILLSAIPIAYLLIKGINRLSKTEACKRFDRWWDKGRLERERLKQQN